MKKLTALLLAALMLLALTGCGGTSYSVRNATSDEEAEEIKAADYKKDFDGLEQYLLDKGYIYTKMYSGDSDETGVTLKTDIHYDIIGAANGVRYYFTDNKTFIEIYDFTGKQDDATAKKILADIKDDGKFRVLENLDELTGVISASGNFVIAYNANNKFDYEKITDELENW